jgi:hypothetical protein
MTLNTVYWFSHVTLSVRLAFEFRSPNGRPFRNRSLCDGLAHREQAGSSPQSHSIQ